MDVIQLMGKSQLFHFLDEKILNDIIESSATTVKYSSGTELFLEGEKARSFFLVLSGKIRISRFSPTGKEVILKNMLPGDSFAEVVIFEQDLYPATATAQEDSTILKINSKSFRNLLNDSRISKPFISNLFKKIRFLTRKIELLNTAEVSDRFYHFIETYYGKSEIVTFKESKKEIAALIGTIPETFSRMIKKLKQDKTILSWDKNQLNLKKDFWENL